MADANIVVEVDSGVELVARQVTAHEQLGRPFQLDVIAMSTLPTTATGGADDIGPRVDIDAIVLLLIPHKAVIVVHGGYSARLLLILLAVGDGDASTFDTRTAPIPEISMGQLMLSSLFTGGRSWIPDSPCLSTFALLFFRW